MANSVVVQGFYSGITGSRMVMNQNTTCVKSAYYIPEWEQCEAVEKIVCCDGHQIVGTIAVNIRVSVVVATQSYVQRSENVSCCQHCIKNADPCADSGTMQQLHV
jgi:hypothetical protein